jgi:MFS family permease
MNFMSRMFGLNLKRQEDRNAWFLIVEIFWASFLSSAASFNSAFALRLGASNADIGLLSSIPALLAILVSIPAGRFIQNLNHRKPWILGSLAIHRGSFLLIALLPFLAGTGLALGPTAVWILILIGIPAYFFNIGFTAMLADVVSEDRRAAVFSGRQIIYNAAVSILIFGLGKWLKLAPFPLNYQVMFVVGVITAFISNYFLLKINVPEKPKAAAPAEPISFLTEIKAIRSALVEQKGFSQIVRNTFIQSFALWAAGPLYILYFVKSLKADESWLGLNGTIVSVVTIFAYMFWRRWLGRLGESKTLKITIALASLYPLLVGLSPSLTLILGAGALYSFFNAGVGLSHFNILLRVMPEDSRPQYTAFWTALMNAGAFVAPLIGVQFANWFGLAPTLIGCGIIAGLGALTFSLWPIKIPEPLPLKLPEEA